MSNMASVRIAYALQVMERLNRHFLVELYPQKITFGQIDARIRTWYNPNLDSRNFFVPGIVAVLIMIISLLFTSMAVIKEREAGTMEQLIVTPIRPVELILGKTIPYAVISLTQMVAVAAFAIFWFDSPGGKPAPAAGRHVPVPAFHPRDRPFHFHDFGHPAAGHDDDVLFHPAVLHAERVCLPDREHAGNCPVAHLSQSPAVHDGHNQGHIPERVSASRSSGSSFSRWPSSGPWYFPPR